MNRFQKRMVILAAGWAAAAAGIMAAQPIPGPAAATDSATIVGTWRAVSIEADGAVSQPDDARKITVVNANDGVWSVLAEGRLIAKGTSELIPWVMPKGIDFEVTDDASGPVPERRSHKGIYELGKDTRRLCFAPPGAERPAAFAAPTGSGFVLITFERVAE